MSYNLSEKDMLRAQIDELERRVDSDKERLAELRFKLTNLNMRERAETSTAQQLLKG
jgi:ribosomal protein L29